MTTGLIALTSVLFSGLSLISLFSTVFCILGLLNRQLCWYLTCERHHQFEGEATTAKLTLGRGQYDAYLILGMVSNKKSIITVFVHKDEIDHKI